MRLNKKLARNLALGIGCLMLLALGVYFLAIRSLNHAFAKADFTPLIVKTKAAGAGLVVTRQAPKSASIQGVLVANQTNPTASQSDAKLFDVWRLSARIAEATLKAADAGSWVHSTEDEKYLATADRHDPWGHPLCVLRRGDTVAVISGGPNARSSPACQDISMSEDELSKLPRARLLETPGGNFILVVSGDRIQSSMPHS